MSVASLPCYWLVGRVRKDVCRGVYASLHVCMQGDMQWVACLYVCKDVGRDICARRKFDDREFFFQYI
jgi:hypothetical protein